MVACEQVATNCNFEGEKEGGSTVGIQSPTATGTPRDCAAECTMRQISAIPRNPLRGQSIWRDFFGAAKVAVRWSEARYLAFLAFFATSQVGRPKCAQKGEGGPSGGKFRRRRHPPSNRRGKRPRWPPPRRPPRAPARSHSTRGRSKGEGGRRMCGTEGDGRWGKCPRAASGGVGVRFPDVGSLLLGVGRPWVVGSASETGWFWRYPPGRGRTYHNFAQKSAIATLKIGRPYPPAARIAHIASRIDSGDRELSIGGLGGV